MNLVELCGELQGVELKTAGGYNICELTLRIPLWKDRDMGRSTGEGGLVQVTYFGDLAREIDELGLEEGDIVVVTGRLRSRASNGDGERPGALSVVGTGLHFVRGASDGANSKEEDGVDNFV